MSSCLVILDRDGVINQDSREFIKSPIEWEALDGSLEAISMLTAANFDVAVVTNQSGIGRKLFTEKTLESIHEKMCKTVERFNGKIGLIAFCPHHPKDDCDCRKPKTALLEKVGKHYRVPLNEVPMIGDSLRDIDAALAVGGRPILVLTGNGLKTQIALRNSGSAIETYANLLEAATALVKQIEKKS